MTLRSRLPIPAVALAIAAAIAPQAHASGFSLREQSPSAMGSSFAGVSAGGTDLSSMYWNPAAMALYSGNQFFLGSSLVMPSAEIENAKAWSAPMFPPHTVPGPANHGNSVNPVPLPSIYGMWAPSPDLRLGMSINVPYGMVVQYQEDFVGRYHALRTDLKTLDVAGSLSYQIAPQLSFGVTVLGRMVKAELSNAIDFGAIGAALGLPGYSPGSADAVADLKGEKWVFGYKYGAIFKPVPTFRVGLAYSGKTDVDISDGEVKYFGVPAAFQSKFKDGGASVAVPLPASLSGGFCWDINSAWTLQGEVAKTQWSDFKELRVKFESGQSDSVVDESWKDTVFYSLGVVWKYSDTLSFRAGIATDEAPMDDAHRTPRVPDGDRTWFSVGSGWAYSKALTFDFGLTYIVVKDGTIALSSGNTPADPNFFRGNLSGTFKNSVTILAASLRYTF